MKVILVGCEYAGKTTLADRISGWMVEMFGPEPWGPPHYGWHDHYQMPNVTHHDMTVSYTHLTLPTNREV